MRNFVITDNMAKGFAAEIENNIEKMNSKGGMPFLNYVLHLKGGKTEQISENTTRMCVTLSLLVPFKIEGITDKKKRGHVFIENGKFSFVSAKDILKVVVDAVENFEYHLKRYKDDSILGYKNTFKEVVEQYGFEDLEKRIADFFEYLTNLGGSEDVEEQTNEVELEDISDDYFVVTAVETLYKGVVLNGIKNVGLVDIIDQLNKIYDDADAQMLKDNPYYYAKVKEIINVCEFAKYPVVGTDDLLVTIVIAISELRDLAYHFVW